MHPSQQEMHEKMDARWEFDQIPGFVTAAKTTRKNVMNLVIAVARFPVLVLLNNLIMIDLIL